MDLWEVPAEGYQLAEAYLRYLHWCSYFSTTFWVFCDSGPLANTSIIIESTGASTAYQSAQMRGFAIGDYSNIEPFWYWFRVYLFPGLEPMDIEGITNPRDPSKVLWVGTVAEPGQAARRL